MQQKTQTFIFFWEAGACQESKDDQNNAKKHNFLQRVCVKNGATTMLNASIDPFTLRRCTGEAFER